MPSLCLIFCNRRATGGRIQPQCTSAHRPVRLFGTARIGFLPRSAARHFACVRDTRDSPGGCTRSDQMSDAFEDHCWKDVITPDIFQIYSSYRRRAFAGPAPALLAVDLYEL